MDVPRSQDDRSAAPWPPGSCSWARRAAGDHFLYDTAHGTFGEEPAARRYAPGLFAALLAWADLHVALS